MKFIKATIENYRSIGTLEIGLNAEGGCNCRILAGINESGKSNVLKGLALLSPDSQVTYSKDINKKAKAEKKDIRVRYQLETNATDLLIEYMKSQSVPEDILDKIEIDRIERVVNFDSANARTDNFFIYLKGMPSISDYTFDSSAKQFVKSEPVKPIPAPATQPESATPAPTPATAVSAPSTTASASLDDKDAWELVLEDYYASAALESLMPKVIFWTYDEKYLINPEINLSQFAETPSTISKPLHNVFNLARYTDAQIKPVITDALAEASQMGELADRLEKAATDYLEEVWPEHRVGIKVHTANPTVSFQVIEKDAEMSGRYEVAERSDGFKHFFAILLNLAAENSTSQLKDCLILLDEPEVHLHPTGAKFLRDELLKISADNTVVYSTHSIFMIDRTCLDRHYKVFKENETTDVIKIDSSNPFKEELIYEALGTSLYEIIREHNILFEGLTDKKLFEAFTYKYRNDIKPLDIYVINVDGEPHFDKYCKFFNGNNVKGYIVADSDNDGVAAKARIIRENPSAYNTKNTFEINDIVATGKNSSLEDLLPTEVLQDCILALTGIALTLDPAKTLAEQIKDYNKSTANTKKIDSQRLKEHIADFVCEDITKSSMTKDKTREKYPTYYDFVESLHAKLKSSNNS